MSSLSIATVSALCALAAGTCPAAPLSPEARTFIAQGPAVVLHGCPKPWPPRNWREGRLLHRGELKRIEDKDSGRPYTYQSLDYEGMSLTLRRAAIVELVVTRPEWPLPMRLRTGMPRAAFEHVLGAPVSEQSDDRQARITYLDTGTEDGVTLDVDRVSGLVTRVSWSFYYD